MSQHPIQRSIRFRRSAHSAFVGLCFLGGAACSSSTDSDSRKVEQSLEIFSWFTAPGEKEALDALLTELRNRHPDVHITNAAESDPTNARQRLEDRLLSGEPPDSFQLISGVDLFRWVDEDKMEPITALARREGWDEVFPSAVLDVVSRDGQMYGVPVNIERDNNLYYSIELLEEHSISPPRTLPEFYAACETLKAEAVVPLSLPAAGWVLALVAFENLMPAVNGGQFYLDFFAGKANPKGVEVQSLFEAFAKVIECSNVQNAEPGWDIGADLMMEGSAAMYVMGDWAKGYMEGKNWVANADFGVVPGLGSADHFTFNSVVFGLPRGAQHPNAARAFLEVVGSLEGQTGFNREKGSVPAHPGVSLSTFDEMVRGAFEDFQEAGEGMAQLLPGYASLTGFDFQVQINPSLLVFAVGGERAQDLAPDQVPVAEAAVPAASMEYILNKIDAYYGLLK